MAVPGTLNYLILEYLQGLVLCGRCVTCYTKILKRHWWSSNPACQKRTWTCTLNGTDSLGVEENSYSCLGYWNLSLFFQNVHDFWIMSHMGLHTCTRTWSPFLGLWGEILPRELQLVQLYDQIGMVCLYSQLAQVANLSLPEHCKISSLILTLFPLSFGPQEAGI